MVAQDPAIKRDGRILTTRVAVPAESLDPGPRGARVHVVDFDGGTGDFYQPFDYEKAAARAGGDPFADVDDDTILSNPGFHASNAYALVMRTLARFEFALGRRIGWGFDNQSHQIQVAPHAFAEANAFYSPRDEALMFGYFPSSSGGTVFSCLAHDVVVHETCHALLGALRTRYLDPSSPDQAGFHEGFSDVAAILSVFALREVVEALVDVGPAGKTPAGTPTGLVEKDNLTWDALKQSALTGLAEQMGREMMSLRSGALRQSATLEPSPDLLDSFEFVESHRRGEILVAAMLHVFLDVWTARIDGLKVAEQRYLEKRRVSEEAAEIADYLLTAFIRALDYAPPCHLTYGDFLSAFLTADAEIRPDDSKYRFRERMLASFTAFGITPAAGTADGGWLPADQRLSGERSLDYSRSHFESMTRDRDEVFRFIWENRDALGLHGEAYTRVLSVRPCQRIAPDDGFPLRETVAECFQQLRVRAGELGRFGVSKPFGMPDDQEVELQGGATLLFDEYGRLKYAVSNGLPAIADPPRAERHNRRLQHLWDYGAYNRGASLNRQFAEMHRRKALDLHGYREAW